MKKIFGFIMAYFMLSAVLSACSSIPDTQKNTDESHSISDTSQTTDAITNNEETQNINTDENNELIIIKDGNAAAVIVYPQGNTELSEIAQMLSEQIKLKYGVEIPCSDDTADLHDETEILLGKTNREVSKNIVKRISEDSGRNTDFICEKADDNIVLAGMSNESTENAVRYFINCWSDNHNAKDSLIYSSDSDTYYTGGYAVKLLRCAGLPLKNFKIVYPKDSDLGEYYVALNLRYKLKTNAGIDLEVIDDSHETSGKEILIGQTNRGLTPEYNGGMFYVSVENGNLCISAKDLFGFLSADSYLHNNLFTASSAYDTLSEDFSRIGKADKMPERIGRYRILFNNCWGLPDQGYANRNEYAVAMYLAYEPDVIALNEYWTECRNQHVIAETLEAYGYAEVKATSNNVMPIFYKKDKVRIIDSTYVRLTEYADASLTTIKQAGESKGVTIAVFEGLDDNGKPNGERFTVCNTHLMSNYLDSVKGWKGHGYASRMINIDTVWETLQPFLAKYPDASVLMGCDYNASANSDECKKIKGLGFVDCHDTAKISDNDCSSHPYPTYDKELGYYVSSTLSKGGYSDSIDHIFQYGNTIDPKVYDTLATNYSGLFSDHAPLLLDFDVISE